MTTDIEFEVNGQQVQVRDPGISLLEALRDRLGFTSVKDGCSPQGQCGCCTVLVDGQARVSCVTPLRRVAGRQVTTIEGLPDEDRRNWAEAFCDSGASQCGFCTPGIIIRLDAAFGRQPLTAPNRESVDRTLAAHLCRCTGWQTIGEAVDLFVGRRSTPTSVRDLDAAARRAQLEGGAPQVVGPSVALGNGRFADDRAPNDALVGVMDDSGAWHLAPTMMQARAAAGRVQGRNTTAEVVAPIDLPRGDWVFTWQTSWVEPGYLETDAAWCEPGGTPALPLANGGAFGSKIDNELANAARRLADEYGRAVRLRWTREDVVRRGPKRPPIAVGVGSDGRGSIRVAATPGVVEAWRAGLGPFADRFEFEEVVVSGPPTSAAIRGAGWVEGAVLAAVLPHLGASDAELSDQARRGVSVDAATGGGSATVRLIDEVIEVAVECGDPIDDIVVRSYVIGAVHMALGWVCSEGLAVDPSGEVRDLTIRSFGIIRPADMPQVVVRINPVSRSPVAAAAPVSTAVFAAVAAAAWLAGGLGAVWPLGRLVVPRR